MTNDSFAALSLVALLRSRGVLFTDTGPEIPEDLAGTERIFAVRRLLTDMLQYGFSVPIYKSKAINQRRVGF